jgi:Flp pilus assembly protein TadB
MRGALELEKKQKNNKIIQEIVELVIFVPILFLILWIIDPYLPKTWITAVVSVVIAIGLPALLDHLLRTKKFEKRRKNAKRLS